MKPTRIEEIDQQLESIAQLGLTPTMRSVLIKRLGEHKTHQEIAQEEGISIETARKRFQRALQRIAPLKTCAS